MCRRSKKNRWKRGKMEERTGSAATVECLVQALVYKRDINERAEGDRCGPGTIFIPEQEAPQQHTAKDRQGRLGELVAGGASCYWTEARAVIIVCRLLPVIASSAMPWKGKGRGGMRREGTNGIQFCDRKTFDATGNRQGGLSGSRAPRGSKREGQGGRVPGDDQGTASHTPPLFFPLLSACR